MPDQPTDRADAHLDAVTLRAHLDDRLPDDEAAAVDAHLDGCEDCAQRLEELEPPVALPAEPAPAIDEGAMRRAVRRTLLRTAVDVIAIVGLVALGVVVLSIFVWQPLVIDRGERVEQAIQASLDLPLLTVPGAEVDQFATHAGLWSRDVDVEMGRAIGAGREQLDDVQATIGPLSATVGPLPAPGGVAAHAGASPVASGRHVDVDRLPNDVAVTVEVTVDGLDHAELDAVADHTEEVAVSWLGFQTPGQTPRVGYSACRTGQAPERESYGWGGFGGTVGDAPRPDDDGGVDHALAQTRRALESVAASGIKHSGGLDARTAAAILDDLGDAEPDVEVIVLTGRAAEVAETVADLDEVTASSLLALDHDLGPPSPCA